jgi:glutaminyl-tRNA synthetase
MSIKARKAFLVPDEDKRMMSPNFITDIIEDDLSSGKHDRVVTRWPPEPNGYIHIGHAKAINLNFGIAQDYGGRCNLRFDDTNPEKEDIEYVEAIKRDIKWLGFDWGETELFASDYFEQLYAFAVRLIKDGKAYVDSLSEEEIRAYRGTVTEPGRESPYRNRTVEENLDLFARMRAGEFPDGAHVLRAKLDMASPNMKMRDPLLYRIRHAHHYRTGDTWPIYPMYDFQHPLSDALEGVTHSLCTLEFENNREIYDWLVDTLFTPPRPHQYEFGRHNIEYVVLGKRNLITLVKGGFVNGWDDPRLPTIAGLRRRGVTPEAIRDFSNRLGIGRSNSRTSIALLEHSIRDDLNFKAPRVMAVLEPLKVTITNYPEGKTERLEASYWPHDVPREGTREVPFSREVFIERSDFMQNPPKGFYRLSPGAEVRLRYAYIIRCDEVIRNERGDVVELRCSYDPETLGRNPEGRKVRGAIHWVSAAHALPVEFRLYERLFTVPSPEESEGAFTDYLNPESLVIQRGYVEPSVAQDDPGTRYQFERQGYFIQDSVDSRPDALIFNRIVTLRDSWAKETEEESGRTEEPPVRRKPQPKPETVQATAATPRDPLLEFTAEQKTRYTQYNEKLGLNPDDAALLAADEQLSRFFEEAVRTHDNALGIANWIVNELQRELKETALEAIPIRPAHLASLVSLIDAGTINTRIAKDVFTQMLQTGDDPQEIVRKEGLEQVTDTSTIEPVVDRLIMENPDKVEAYRGGKTGLLGFFVGQVMRETGGKANPQLVQDLVKQKLS